MICASCGEIKDKGKRCKPCYNSYMRKYNKKNSTKNRERNRLYKLKNKSIYENSKLKHSYGITLEQRQVMEEQQEGLCAICNSSETRIHNKSKRKQKLSIDHCHTTGKIRGLLCSRCNLVLGQVEDSPSLLSKMILYLKEIKNEDTNK